MRLAKAIEQANTIVHGDRNRDYGHPLDNHGTTATFWSAYLARRYGVQLQLTPEDVCWMNVLQKVSREANGPKHDNIVDVIGYAANVEMIRDEREARAGALGESKGV